MSGTAPVRDRMGVRDLADRFGTPAYVYELADVDAAAQVLRRALPAPSRLLYSLKANPHPLIAHALRAGGCDAEISSLGELAAARQAGFTADQCLYTGPGKSEQEVAVALDTGVRRFSVESAADFHRVASAAEERGTTADCLVRINTLRATGTSGLRMSGVASQFGVDVAVLEEEPTLFAARPGARVVGLHFFSVSNAAAETAIVEEARANIAVAAWLREVAGVDLRVLDLGGGFAAPYAKPGPLPDYTGLRDALEAALDEHLAGWRDGDPEIAFESGRYLAGVCGRLVARVADVKRSQDRTFLVLDSGINHLGGLAGLGRLLPVSAAVVPAVGPPGEAALAEQVRATVVGPLCTPADVLARDVAIASARVADLVEIPNVGAYGLTASLVGFLSRPAAAEIVLRDGVLVDASRVELRRVPIDQGAAESGESRHEGSD
ncbi:MAG: alanine racemase [Actinophytocola sp.]|uniref:alanine racemase n=1 Tax=Actinophytocola sp. TaxID=1872138 RepID=UPI003C742EF7